MCECGMMRVCKEILADGIIGKFVRVTLYWVCREEGERFCSFGVCYDSMSLP